MYFIQYIRSPVMSNFATNVLKIVQVFGFPFFAIFANHTSRLHNLFMLVFSF